MDKLYFDVWTCLFYTIIGILCSMLISGFMRSTDRMNPMQLKTYARRSKNRTYLLFAILLILAVFRRVSPVLGGTDVPNYINNFLTIQEGGIDRKANAELEPGFQLITRLIRLFTDNFKVYFMFMYGIIVYGYIRFIKDKCPKGVCYFPFILLMYPYLKSFNTMRTSVAIAFFLLGICYLDKSKWKSLLLITSSLLFHRVSMLFVLVWPFYMVVEKLLTKMSRWIFVVVTIVGIAVVYVISLKLQQYAILFQVVEGTDAYYIQATLGQNYFMRYPMFFGQMILFILLVVNYNSIKWEGQTKLLKTVFIYDLWMVPAGLVFGMWRSIEYLYLVRLSLWALIISTMTKHKFKKIAVPIKIAFAIVFVFWLVFRVYKEWEDTGISPYVFEFFTDENTLRSIKNI